MRADTMIEKALLSIEEVARILDVHPGTVRNLIKDGELATVRIRKVIRISREELDAYIKRNQQRR